MASLLNRLALPGIALLLSAALLGAEQSRKPIGVPIETGRKHWAFQPLKTFDPPKVSDPKWISRPIDAWILAKLDEQGLKPSPSADRATLIRRVTFDVIGLPPTPEEITAFENDPRPDAYAQLVERLLASPRHGERSAHFWLDLARYCDVPEGWVERKSQPWLYRDWVVSAMNEDMPFDRFVRLQLAADRVPDARPSEMAALGFLGLSPDYFKELQLSKEIISGIVADEWEERVGTVCGTFLGLTAACARCHDHKFEPITTRDYYALAGVFANSRPTDRELLPEPAASRVHKARTEMENLEARITELKKKVKPVQTAVAKATTAPSTAPTTAPSTQPTVVDQIMVMKVLIAGIEARNPELAKPAAFGVDDAALHINPATGHGTRLDYTPGEAIDLCIQLRGNPQHPAAVAPRRFMEVLSPPGKLRPLTTGSGRIDLAEAILHEAAPLTARVIVNRIWKQHFGRGIVETPSDFGFQGDRPSHPELLDDLAARFIEHGWSLRWLHREILLSSTYQQSSAADETRMRLDADNRWLSRMNRRRLDAEGWRDAILASAGTLDLTPGGPSRELSEAANTRRTLYGTIKRADMNDYLRLNDFPDPLERCSVRVPTTTPLQGLFVLNSPMVLQQSAAFAARIRKEAPADPADTIRRAWMLAYGHPPSEHQIQRIMTFLTHDHPGGAIDDAAWNEFAQAIFGSNEFMFVD